MSPLKLSFITATVAALLTLGVHRHISRGRAQEASRLRDENNRMSFEINQRHQTHLAITAEANRTAKHAQSYAGQPNQAVIPAGSALISGAMGNGSSGDYRYAGQATSVATMQSLAWVCDQGDAATMQKLIRFDDAARPKAEAYYASLPAQVRAPWASIEAMAAALLISDGIDHPYPVTGIIAQAKVEQINPDRVALLLPETNRERTEYQQTPEGWKLAITAAMVDGYIKLGGQQAEASR